MTTVAAPLCVGCVHLRRGDAAFACDAYPDGIPEPIVASKVDHRQPYDGDNGIRFEPESPDDARYAADLFDD